VLVTAGAAFGPALGQVSTPVFSADRVDPCGFGAGPGFAGERFVLALSNDLPANDPLRRVVIADWADVPRDTVFDTVDVRLAVFLSDGDATPGVLEGSSVTVRLYDADDGFGDVRRTLAATGTSGDLPADTSGGAGAFVTVSIPLGDTVELGDSGAAPDGTTPNPLSFADLDDDGLHDFGYEIEVDAPAGAVGRGIGVVLVGPDLAGGGPVDPPGMIDLYDERRPAAAGGGYIWTFSLGGATCGSGPLATDGTTPFAQAYLVLGTGPVGCGPADIAPPFGILDLSDNDAFIAAFLAGDALADVAPPFGILDLTDTDTFITAFLAGCP